MYKSRFKENDKNTVKTIYTKLLKTLYSQDEISVIHEKIDNFKFYITFDKAYNTRDGVLSWDYAKEFQVYTNSDFTQINLLNVRKDKIINTYPIDIKSIKAILLDIDKLAI